MVRIMVDLGLSLGLRNLIFHVIAGLTVLQLGEGRVCATRLGMFNLEFV